MSQQPPHPTLPKKQPRANNRSPRQKKNSHTEIIVALIGAAAVIIAAIISGIFLLVGRTSPLSQPANITPTTTPATHSVEPTATFGFENGIEYWIAPESGDKSSKVDVTTERVHAGAQALRLTTVLIGNGNNAFPGQEYYTHSEAMVYFDQPLPGLSRPGPYDLTGKPVSCFVYLPNALAPGNNPQAFIRMFAKDKRFANDYGPLVDIDRSQVEQWFQISLTIGKGDMDTGFNPKRVWGIGVLIETNEGSTLNFTGSLYIDDCFVGHT